MPWRVWNKFCWWRGTARWSTTFDRVVDVVKGRAVALEGIMTCKLDGRLRQRRAQSLATSCPVPTTNGGIHVTIASCINAHTVSAHPCRVENFACRVRLSITVQVYGNRVWKAVPCWVYRIKHLPHGHKLQRNIIKTLRLDIGTGETDTLKPPVLLRLPPWPRRFRRAFRSACLASRFCRFALARCIMRLWWLVAPRALRLWRRAALRCLRPPGMPISAQKTAKEYRDALFLGLAARALFFSSDVAH